MTECDHMLTELEEKILKWQGARDAGEKDSASDREKADLKMAQEDLLGFQQLVRKYVLAEGSEQEKVGLRGLNTIALPANSQPRAARRLLSLT
jgi:hypothetical protein